jgi:hypothetical protein
MQRDSSQHKLTAVFVAAMQFGLSVEDVWAVARAVADRFPGEAKMSEWFDDLIDALARRIEETV